MARNPRPRRPSKRPARPSTRPPAPQEPLELQEPQESLSFAVVGIGASAGGLDALRRMFRALATDTGVRAGYAAWVASARA